MKDIYLSVIIPCYNEERNIRLGALENVSHFLNKKKYPWEVILVNDGSKDDSVKLIREFIKDHSSFKLLNIIHKGKAAAVISGVFESKGEIILFSDLDQATPIAEIDKLLPNFSKGFDIVIGSRSGHRRGAPFFRLAMARGFMALRNMILNLGIRDTQCGFKAFRKETAGEIFSRLKVFSLSRQAQGSTVTAGFDVELLYLAKLLGYRVKEVSVEWNYQETRHVNPIKDSIEGVMDLLRIRLNSLKGIYEKK